MISFIEIFYTTTIIIKVLSVFRSVQSLLEVARVPIALILIIPPSGNIVILKCEIAPIYGFRNYECLITFSSTTYVIETIFAYRKKMTLARSQSGSWQQGFPMYWGMVFFTHQFMQRVVVSSNQTCFYLWNLYYSTGWYCFSLIAYLTAFRKVSFIKIGINF